MNKSTLIILFILLGNYMFGQTSETISDATNQFLSTLSQEEIELLNNHIEKKQNDLLEIKNKIHWKWVLADNELEKHCIKEYIINNQ